MYAGATYSRKWGDRSRQQPLGLDLIAPSCYSNAMTAKEKVLKAVQALPEDASIEDAMERLLFLAKVERGLQQADSSRTLSHEQLKERMSKWLR